LSAFESADRVDCHCGKPAVYGPPDLCREHALAKLDQMIAACTNSPAMAQSSARWRLESERARLLAEEARP
jgi:hypothetical protein